MNDGGEGLVTLISASLNVIDYEGLLTSPGETHGYIVVSIPLNVSLVEWQEPFHSAILLFFLVT